MDPFIYYSKNSQFLPLSKIIFFTIFPFHILQRQKYDGWPKSEQIVILKSEFLYHDPMQRYSTLFIGPKKWAKWILFQRAKSDPCPLLMHKVNILGCYPTGSENTSITIDIEWLLRWYWLNGPDFEQNRSKKISPLVS